MMGEISSNGQISIIENVEIEDKEENPSLPSTRRRVGEKNK